MIRLPAIFSDGMVLEKNAKIWGTADAGEIIETVFIDKVYRAVADDRGNWELTVTAEQFGGPHVLKIGDKVLNDVMIGYVWLCSGQSNMELPIARVKRMFSDELQNVNFPNIRAFLVRKAYDFNNELQLYDGEGEWKAAINENIDAFFATAYFFARKLWDRYGIPIGLICSAAGGSTAEAWISEEALKPFPKHIACLEECKNVDFVRETERADLQIMHDWHGTLDEKDEGLKWHWENPEFDDYLWNKRELTESWERDLNFNGSVWFRKEFDVPQEMVGKPATLFLGRVVDSNYVYVNGKFVGRIEYQYPPSIFGLPPDVLHEGKNSIAVRVISNSVLGGFIKDKPYKIITGDESGIFMPQKQPDTIDLLGMWKYKTGAVMPPMPPAIFFFRKPVGLYNAMLSPVIGYSITGAIWYQGESNTHYPEDYRDLMSALITNWRNGWRKDFPFIFTQLVNFEANSAPYPDSGWAELREQQLRCLDIPNTAMAVGIDCGEYNDLHPLDKKTLGERLALAAFKLAYGEDITASGPIICDTVLSDDKIIISFEHTGAGLTVSNGGTELEGFEIVEESGCVRYVDAKIDGHKVVIDLIGIEQKPKAVRYAWADNPVASLYNSEGLPASPFRAFVTEKR